MAEGAILSVAQSIIRSLATAALKEMGQPWGLKQQLQELRDTMSAMEAVLRDAEDQHASSHQAIDWVSKLEDTLYKADDLVDAIGTEALGRRVRFGGKRSKKVRIFFSSSNQFAFRLKIGKRLKKIQEKLNKIKQIRSLYMTNMNPAQNNINASYPLQDINDRETHSLVHPEDIIGRDSDKMRIIQLLVCTDYEDQDLMILPIVGLGGLGKTTLAKLVFNDPKIDKFFESKLWVCVSDVFDLKEIVKKMIEPKENLENFDLNSLKNRLRDKLQGKRYVLVLDDIWNENQEKWEELEELLRVLGAKGSRVLVTTRSKLVARITKTTEPFELSGLDEDQSWSLFRKMAFKKGKEPDESRISPMKKEVVEKCWGVPLVLKTIGRLFQSKMSLYPEEDVENICLSFMNDELNKVIQEGDDILKTLKISYDRLPSQLKHCFAFCRLFPKDYEIGVEEVINLWIAQGFIKSSSENQNDLEDVGYAHFMHLVWGSFFEPPFKSDDDDVVKFKIHDAMHDLAILMAGTTGVVIDGPKAKVFDDRTRHVSLTFSSIELWKIPMDSLKQNRKLRTFLSSNQKHDDFIQRPFYYKGISEVILSSFKLLRVLGLYSMGFSKLPNTIGGLKYLRYLNLSSNPFVSLPNSITTLHNLHTLNLEYCEKLWRLPQEIDKLLNLKHLLLKGCLSLVFMPSGLGRLTSLRRLGEFNQCSYRSKNIARLEELGNLNSLRGSLRINLKHGKHDSLECSAAHLNKKQHLQHIILSWEVEGDDDITGEMIESDELSLDALQPHQNLKILTIHQCTGIRLAHWLSLLTNLVYLSLDACIKCQQLPELDQLPSLQELHLSELGSLEYISPKFSASSLFFPSLTSLSIFHCPKLKGWWRDSANLNQAQGHFVLPSFSCLSVLNIYDCRNLTSMPLFPNLEKFFMYKCSSKLLLEDTIMRRNIAGMVASSSSSSSSSASFSLLSKLEHLAIEGINEDEDVEFLRERIANLFSLRFLQICECDNLASLQKLEYLCLVLTESCSHHA